MMAVLATVIGNFFADNRQRQAKKWCGRMGNDFVATGAGVFVGLFALYLAIMQCFVNKVAICTLKNRCFFQFSWVFSLFCETLLPSSCK